MNSGENDRFVLFRGKRVVNRNLSLRKRFAASDGLRVVDM